MGFGGHNGVRYLGACLLAAEAMVPAHARQDGVQATTSTDEIVVIAERSQRDQIDRRSYVVRDNARTQSLAAIDIMDEIPAVTVSPGGQLRLLGTSGVKILVNGKEIADPMAYLRALPSARIKRIEVMTNPSAQFSAVGTAGIINLILREPAGQQSKATAVGAFGSYGDYDWKISPSLSRGRWSLIGSVGRSRGSGRTAFDIYRTTPPGSPFAAFSETGSTRGASDTLSGNGILTFKPDERQDISLSVNGIQADGHGSSVSSIVAPTFAIDQLSTSRSRVRSSDLDLDYKRQLGNKGGTLSLSLASGNVSTSGRSEFSSDSGTTFLTSRSYHGRTFDFELAYVNPIDSDRILSTGVSWKRNESRNTESNGGTALFGSPLPTTAYRTTGHWTEVAGFATYQFHLSKWTIMPGLRIEARDYRLGPGSGGTRNDVHVFPTFHLRRDFASDTRLGISYSRRIARPEIAQLSTALHFSDSTTASGGNPLLEPELTDSVEAKLDYRWAKQTATLTSFYRVTHDPWVDITTATTGGLYIATPTNAGTRTRLGGNLSLQGSIGKHFRYSANGTLVGQRYFGAAPADSHLASFEYGGSLQLEFRDADEEGPGFDSLVINGRYSGPVRTPYLSTGAYRSIDLNWTHGISRRASSNLKVTNLLGNTLIRQMTRFNEIMIRRTSRISGPRVTLSLVYRIGHGS